MYSADEAVRIARAEVGYLEKATCADLDSKTANAGRGNFTKYARDLHEAGYYQGSKQGYPWCDVFFDWVIWKLCGTDAAGAQEITCQTGPCGAGCGSSARYYRQQGRFGTGDPRPGDQIFFWDTGKTHAAHTGIVTAVDDTHVYTVEGNTSGASGVVANGGGVCAKRYALDDDRICGYGHPKYDEGSGAQMQPAGKEGTRVKMETLRRGSRHPHVRVMQLLLIGSGYGCGSHGADGDFGSATQKAVIAYQEDHKDADGRPLAADGICGPRMWGSLLRQ